MTTERKKSPTEILLDEIEAKLKSLGIEHYVVAARDPDQALDLTRHQGSTFWLLGFTEWFPTNVKNGVVDVLENDDDPTDS